MSILDQEFGEKLPIQTILEGYVGTSVEYRGLPCVVISADEDGPTWVGHIVDPSMTIKQFNTKSSHIRQLRKAGWRIPSLKWFTTAFGTDVSSREKHKYGTFVRRVFEWLHANNETLRDMPDFITNTTGYIDKRSFIDTPGPSRYVYVVEHSLNVMPDGTSWSKGPVFDDRPTIYRQVHIQNNEQKFILMMVRPVHRAKS